MKILWIVVAVVDVSISQSTVCIWVHKNFGLNKGISKVISILENNHPCFDLIILGKLQKLVVLIVKIVTIRFKYILHKLI